jgi:antirestriction protein ArdC
MSTQITDLYATVTNQIIAALEAGTPPWTCPWARGQGSALPVNIFTRKPYRGINVLLLNMQALSNGYPTNRWMTLKQCNEMDARIRKGERATPIVFFKMLEREDAGTEDRGRKVIPLIRSYNVFNVAQMDDLPQVMTGHPAPPAGWTPIAAAEDVLTRSGATIRHGGNRAYYRPADDVIQLPPKEAFPDASHYYGTALHELTHWTGAESRCNRVLSSRAHIEAYAFEELVAEMGAAFLSSHCGLPGELHHASYIGSWLTALKNDKRLIFTAASMAQKAADFLLPAPETAPVAEAVEVAA